MQPTQTREAVEAAESPGAARRAPRPKPGERRIHILQTLATMLEAPRGEKITTAALAARLGVSEAALYRHFASKAQMYEGLIDFIEQTLFGLINQIVEKEPSGVLQARAIALMLVNFSTRNAGMTRVLTCEALVGEHERLAERVNQMLDRVEASLRQCLRVDLAQEAERQAISGSDHVNAKPAAKGYDPTVRANLVVRYVIGCWHRYAQSGFTRSPGEHADEQIRIILQ
ncbi:nucleoid occlusion factor SlmA [Paraburkholderia silvatlantica]|uniref:TetR/AcrR family transcriptional regulator n=1 Tax=Paraburkholderia silvatlantica TaxID=321895 RepID=A0ABR6FIA1_9BURK|nr:nucleoid occlusion factor SlmA [Paraburkholderia silvatlantica]MBB2927157.1 TetR/AcrR family transcriptional regulator [Paraburkholderia silvatlantica]PVY36878.1 TetR family transcriptional regulator [Paraburkholderia silvatlantica]PXW41844.1 TetR family transcriptional regulator [Paraburkholderia silvatlantica]